MERWSRLMTGGILMLMLGSGCGSEADKVVGSERPRPASSVSSEVVEGPLVIFLGDSLTAGYGLSEDEAFPALWAADRAAAGRPVRVVNAGISGDTTAGGVARLGWLLAQEPHVVVIELGANDGLRGLSLTQTRDNLDAIIRRCLEAGARVLLIGMKIPPSYGAEYSDGFAALFEDLATTQGVALMPFLLAGVAADPELNQTDAIHPNAAGHRRLAENVAPFLEEVLTGL